MFPRVTILAAGRCVQRLSREIPAIKIQHHTFMNQLQARQQLSLSQLTCQCQRQLSTGPPPKKKKAGEGRGPVTWKTVAVTLGAGALLLGGMQYVKHEKEIELEKQRNRMIGKAAIGGAWELTDHHGNKKKHSDFFGDWVLIYFGFTHCPDICPDEIEKMVEVVDELDKRKNLPKIQPLFFSVDPQRDTPAVIKNYVAEFSPRLIGFTGTEEEVRKVTRTFRVYFSQGPVDEDNDYIVDHSIIMYLMNPEGEFIDYYGQNKTAEQIVDNIGIHMAKYKYINK